MDIQPITGSLGAEISGVDLSHPLDTSAFEQIRGALSEYLVLFFPDQDITPDQQVAFGRRFGELHVHPFIPHLEGHKEIIVLGSGDDGPGENTRQSNVWHTDLTYTKTPPMGSLLHAIAIPAAGGDTMFADMYAAFDALSSPIQKFLLDLTAIHDIGHTLTRDEFFSGDGLDKLKRTRERTPPIEHPVIRTHPETGRKALFVNAHFVSHFKDLEPAESDALLAFLLDHVNRPEFQCRHRWAKHDLALWDNRCTQHYAVIDYSTRRTMHRVTICGDVPV